MEIPKGFPKSVGRVESRVLGFPYSVISMACFGNVATKAHFREQQYSSETAQLFGNLNAKAALLLHFPKSHLTSMNSKILALSCRHEKMVYLLGYSICVMGHTTKYNPH